MWDCPTPSVLIILEKTFLKYFKYLYFIFVREGRMARVFIVSRTFPITLLSAVQFFFFQLGPSFKSKSKVWTKRTFKMPFEHHHPHQTFERVLCLVGYVFDMQTYLRIRNWWRTTFDGRGPLMEDNFWWKMTFDGMQTLMEDALLWKMTFDGRRPLMERRPLMGRQPLTGDNLWRETTFDWRQPLMEDNL